MNRRRQMNVSDGEPSPDGGIRVVFCGELDAATTAGVHAQLDTALSRRPDRLLIDVSAVTFFSCTTARMVSDVNRRTGTPVTLTGATRPVHRLLHIMQLDKMLEPPTAAA